ncbi:hypothetical protein [Butyricimonas virosa]|uniref:hypothetical protein n=1 Tax=Butyricimonas virosa TaxID=544645 RepID=UPI00307BB988
MEIAKKKLEDLITAAEKIVEANSQPQEDLFGEVRDPNAVAKILDIPLQDPDQSYKLYYQNIQKFLGEYLPKDNDISKVIRNLICILLAHRELSGITYGVRGADSRMATTTDMENIIDVLSEWSETPTDYFKLAHILLRKNKELKYIPEDRDLKDYCK